MITINTAGRIRKVSGGKRTLLELSGLSTDEKPTDKINNTYIDNGSIFIEIDTGKIYMYNLDDKQWEEI